MRAGHITRSVSAHGQQRRFLKSSRNIDEAVPIDWTRHVGKTIAVTHSPDLRPGIGIVRSGAVGSHAHDLVTITHSNDERTRGRLVERIPPRPLPSRFAGRLVEGDDKRRVAPIATDDQQILVHRWRAAVTVLGLIGQSRLPDYLAGLGQRCRATGAEMYVHTIAFDDRRGGSVA